MEILLTHAAPNQAVLDLGNITLYFSYDACIAFMAPGERWFNPAYRGYSVTTSRHAGQMGVKDYPDATDEAAFGNLLRLALLKNILCRIAGGQRQ